MLGRRGFLASIPFAMVSTNLGSLRQNDGHKTTFARWHCCLNHWSWPVDWGEPSEEFVAMTMLSGRQRYNEFNRLGYGTVMNALKILATEKECLRVWNTEVRKDPGKMTQSQFEQWWSEEQAGART